MQRGHFHGYQHILNAVSIIYIVTWPLIGHRENSLQALTVHDGGMCTLLWCYLT